MLDRLAKQAVSVVMLRKHATRVLRICRQVGRVPRVRFNGLLEETRVFIQGILLHTRPEHSIASEHTRIPAPARRESALKDLLRCRVLLKPRELEAMRRITKDSMENYRAPLQA